MWPPGVAPRVAPICHARHMEGSPILAMHAVDPNLVVIGEDRASTSFAADRSDEASFGHNEIRFLLHRSSRRSRALAFHATIDFSEVPAQSRMCWCGIRKAQRSLDFVLRALSLRHRRDLRKVRSVGTNIVVKLEMTSCALFYRSFRNRTPSPVCSSGKMNSIPRTVWKYSLIEMSTARLRASIFSRVSVSTRTIVFRSTPTLAARTDWSIPTKARAARTIRGVGTSWGPGSKSINHCSHNRPLKGQID